MDCEPDYLYQLQGRADDNWSRVAGGPFLRPFLYCELAAARADAHLLLAHYPGVRVINRSTGKVEYTAGRVY